MTHIRRYGGEAAARVVHTRIQDGKIGEFLTGNKNIQDLLFHRVHRKSDFPVEFIVINIIAASNVGPDHSFISAEIPFHLEEQIMLIKTQWTWF